jgi:hypothetical protein
MQITDMVCLFIRVSFLLPPCIAAQLDALRPPSAICISFIAKLPANKFYREVGLYLGNHPQR